MSTNQAVKSSGMESCRFGTASATVIVQMTQGGKHRLLTTDILCANAIVWAKS